MTLRAAMVLTTIADPVVLEGYFANFAEQGHLEQVQVIVIPDRKTPPTAFLRCADLRNRGLDVVCPTLEQQERTLRCLGFPPDLVPYDSDNRRNVGYLMAVEAGANFLISIDDDNYGKKQYRCGVSGCQVARASDCGFWSLQRSTPAG
jgi:hypothetical protein